MPLEAPEKRGYAIRPLTRGMHRNVAAQVIEDGGFRDINNAIVDTAGLYRRPAFHSLPEHSYLDNPVGAGTWIQNNGQVYEIMFTESGVYTMSAIGGLTHLPLAFSDGTVSSGEDTMVTKAAGDVDWTDDTGLDPIVPGDWFKLDASAAVVRIAEVSDGNTILLEQEYPGGAFIEAAYTIYRGFRAAGTRYLPQMVVANNRAMFTSPFSQPLEINASGNALEVLQAGSGPTLLFEKPFTAAVCGWYKERLYLGNTTEWLGDQYVGYPQRLRWSTAIDIGDFRDYSFMDLDYGRGAMKGILPLGDLLGVYNEDAIYLGQPTPDVNLPVTFDQVESGGIGLVSSAALVRYLDGHFFVGQNNVYFLSTRGLEPVGNAVLSETVGRCQHPWRIIAAMDSRRDRICFGFPESTEQIEKVWNFNLQTGAWSYEGYRTWMLGEVVFDRNLKWNDLDAFTWANVSDTWPTWEDMSAEGAVEPELVREFEGHIQLASRAMVADDEGGPVVVQLESKDHDLDAPDLEKCFTRLAMKLQFIDGIGFDTAVDYRIEVSQNKGRSWKDVGVLRIRPNMDEGHVDFRLTGSTFRFRATSQSQVVPYRITEYSFNVTGFGIESHLKSQEA